MRDLIERLERAGGPSRELDFAILCEIDQRAKKTGPVYSDPHYTASIDAAMTLLPEGWYTFYAAEDRHSHAWTWKLRRAGLWATGIAPIPAIALCIAALKAKEADNG